METGREQSQWVEGLSTTLSGLRAATQYRVRVSAASGTARELSARTPADAPAAPPGNVTAVGSGDTVRGAYVIVGAWDSAQTLEQFVEEIFFLHVGRCQFESLTIIKTK